MEFHECHSDIILILNVMIHSTISKTLAKSMNTPSVVSLFSMESVNLSIRFKTASMVKLISKAI